MLVKQKSFHYEWRFWFEVTDYNFSLICAREQSNGAVGAVKFFI